MKRFNVCFTALLALLLLPLLAFGLDSVVVVEKVTPTYGVSGVALTPAATPTDIFLLKGSATKTIRIRRITVSGIAASAGSMDVSLVKRSTVNTGGTSALVTIYKADSNYATPTATASLYSANATTLGTTSALFKTKTLNFGVAGAAGVVEFAWPSGSYVAPILRGAAQGIAIYLNGAAVPTTGKFSYDVEWEEI